MKLIKPRIHLLQDTVISSFLIIAPMFFPLGKLAATLSILVGIFVFSYVHITRFPGAILPRISKKIHFVLDISGLVVAILLPWFIFSDPFEIYYFFTIGLAGIPLLIFSDFEFDTPETVSTSIPDGSSFFIWIKKVAACSLISFLIIFVSSRLIT